MTMDLSSACVGGHNRPDANSKPRRIGMLRSKILVSQHLFLELAGLAEACAGTGSKESQQKIKVVRHEARSPNRRIGPYFSWRDHH